VVLIHCRSQNPSEQFAFKTINEIFTGFLIQSEAFLWDRFGEPMPNLQSGRLLVVTFIVISGSEVSRSITYITIGLDLVVHICHNMWHCIPENHNLNNDSTYVTRCLD